MCLPEARSLGCRIELAFVDRVGDEADRAVRHAQRGELAAFGVADREHAGGVFEIAAPGGGIEDLFRKKAPFDDWRGAMRRDDVRNARRGEQASGDRHGQVAAGVQMCDVDSRQRGPDRAHQADRGEHLAMKGQRVRKVAQGPDLELSGAAVRCMRHADARARVAGIGGTDRDVVAEPCQRVGESGGHPGNAAVRPRVLVVRNDVQDAERGHQAESMPYSIRVR